MILPVAAAVAQLLQSRWHGFRKHCAGRKHCTPVATLQVDGWICPFSAGERKIVSCDRAFASSD